MKEQLRIPMIAILLLALLRVAASELTEEDIIAKELAWAKRAVKHYQHGFNKEHPLNWKIEEMEEQDAYFAMPEHIPMEAADDDEEENEEEDFKIILQKSNLRGVPLSGIPVSMT